MSERVTIDRLAVTLEGWPADAAEGLGGALERALRERLGVARIAPSEHPAGRLSLGVIDAPAGIDATALADLVADRLVARLARSGGGESDDG
jgi:hypothetical protein